jgi:hypothetical protein
MATRFKDVFSTCRWDRIRGRLLKHCPDYKRHQATRQGWTLRGDSEPRAECPLLAGSDGSQVNCSRPLGHDSS